MTFLTSRLIKELSKDKINSRSLGKTESQSLLKNLDTKITDLSTSQLFLDFLGNYNVRTGTKRPILPMTISIETGTKIPKIVLLINPESFSINNNKKINEVNLRYKINDEHAFDDLSTMEISGTTGLFYSEKGLTVDKRKDSATFGNLQKLIAIYRNNGAEYKSLSLYGSDQIKYIERMYFIKIAYNNIDYLGSFDSFSVEETSDQPYNLSFSFSFTIHSINDSNSYQQESVISAFANRVGSTVQSLMR
ncbi:MAG: hypothetical protein WC934_12355 [Acidithiobacillus sp.]|jgi:hypothetical protein|uniref:hypothetical protein n=1 Tax=Acidithiobacillus sp. TaxID=1872118 RepID=UPI003560C83B